MPDDNLYALIAGGGSGGHVMPGIALADALVAAGHDSRSIRFMGSSRGLEVRLVPQAGYTATLFDLQSFPRRLALTHVKAAARLTAAIGKAVGVVRHQRPKVIVSVGGYASLPGVLAAVVTRTPLVVLSYDMIPGRSSQLAARFAKHCAVAFASSPLPHKVVTGAAIRSQILAINRPGDGIAARERLGIPLDRLVMVVVGGSQGSGALNSVIDAFVDLHRDRTDLAIRHIVGTRNIEQAQPGRDRRDGIVYQPIGYEDDMASCYAAADIVLARAGATTIFELAAVGVSSILVPWPDAAEDHQTANAGALGDVGGTIVVAERDFTVERLDAALRKLADPTVRTAMEAAARGVGHRDGAARIAAVVEDCAAS